MTKRLLSLLLAVLMLLTICLGTVSCDFGGGDDTGEGSGEGDGNQGGNQGGNEGGNNGGNQGTGNGGDWVMPEDEYTIEREEGCNLLTIYWGNANGVDISQSDLWIWYADVSGQGYNWHECDYGYKVVVNIPEEITEVGFIVRLNCPDAGTDKWISASKDASGEDRFAVMTGENTVIYLRKGDDTQYSSTNGGKDLTVIKNFALAGITEVGEGYGKIRYNITPATKITSLDQIKVMDGDREVPIKKLSSLGKSASTGIITIDETLDISKAYTVIIEGYEPEPAVPTTVFDTNYFRNLYNYDGTDLGATINDDGTATFKVWAPTASKVVLNLYKDGKKGVASEGDVSYDMTGGTAADQGVWSITVPCVHGTFYTYSVTTSVGTQEAVDPYAKSAGVNGERGMVVDLSQTNPDGWFDSVNMDFSTGIDSYSDAIVWEIHIRDFSNTITDENLPEEYRGKYLAFTKTGLVNGYGQPVGIDYLKQLGVTHVHLLPSYDYATVDEDYEGEDYDPTEFNWGYDPKNYNVPEGSYSTNPYDGVTRIKEYKEMVMALHQAGIGVVMDVVYNHTYDKNASFNKIVPYYYYRYTSTGANTSGSGCGNDTASERYMFGKFMAESVEYWIKEYNLDGFRFDLMGLHTMDAMQKVESAVHNVDPEAIIYGEGWTMSPSPSSPSNQSNIKNITATNNAIGTIAVFNDAIRDALKGSTFEEKSTGYISGSYLNDETQNKVMFGIKGGMEYLSTSWIVNDAMVVNYISAHDNHTLWDKLTISAGNKSVEDRLAMNRMGATIIFASKGMVFFQAGEEFLRSKPNGDGTYNHNSYNSSDEVNNIRWDVLNEGTNEYNMMEYYKGLIDIRKTYDLFSNNSTKITNGKQNNGSLYVTYTDGQGRQAMLITNASGSDATFGLTGNWYVLCDGQNASAVGTLRTGNISIPKYSAVIVVSEALYNATNSAE